MVQLVEFFASFSPDIIPNIFSGKEKPEAIAIGTIKNNNDLPKSKRDIPKFILNTGANILAENIDKETSSIMRSEITLTKK